MSTVSYETPTQAHVRGGWMENGQSYPARIGGLWNGWAEPLVTAEVAQRICADQAKMLDGLDEELRAEQEALRFDEEAHAVIVTGPDDFTATIEPHWNEEAGENLFALGLGWCWEVVEEDALSGPTEEQRAAVKRLKAEWNEPGEFATYSHTVRADGSHAFDVLVEDEGATAAEGVRCMVAALRIVVAKDGTVSREQVNR